MPQRFIEKPFLKTSRKFQPIKKFSKLIFEEITTVETPFVKQFWLLQNVVSTLGVFVK